MKPETKTTLEEVTGKPFEEITIGDVSEGLKHPHRAGQDLLETFLHDMVRVLPDIASAIVKAFLSKRK